VPERHHRAAFRIAPIGDGELAPRPLLIGFTAPNKDGDPGGRPGERIHGERDELRATQRPGKPDEQQRAIPASGKCLRERPHRAPQFGEEKRFRLFRATAEHPANALQFLPH
jgi:hypothetical protein